MTAMSDIATLEMSDARAESVLRSCLETFPHVRLTVTGHCMEPALRDGESVVLTSCQRMAPRLGDVVLAAHSDGLRLHRVVWATATRLRTKGDRSPRWDPLVRRAEILATVMVAGETGQAHPARDRWRALVSLARGAFDRLRESVPGTRRA